jgi:hypothetical protein
MLALLFLFACLQAADGILTYHGLQQSGVSELNPIGRFVFDKLGLIPGLVAMKGAAFGAGLVCTAVPGGIWLLTGLCAFYCWVVAQNARIAL